MKDLQVTFELDETDQKLLSMLRENSRRSNASLAEELGLAQSTCLARIKALKARGVIRRFTVDVDAGALGKNLEALVFVRIRAGARHRMTEFAHNVGKAPGVAQVFFLGGDEDFMVHVQVANAEEVRDFVVEHLSSDPAVANTRTSLVFEHLRS